VPPNFVVIATAAIATIKLSGSMKRRPEDGGIDSNSRMTTKPKIVSGRSVESDGTSPIHSFASNQGSVNRQNACRNRLRGVPATSISANQCASASASKNPFAMWAETPSHSVSVYAPNRWTLLL
jgi:hypothetical protein